MLKLTQAQLDALYQVYQRWQNKTPHAIMPEEFEVVEEEELKPGYNIGTWVGEPDEDKEWPQSMGYMYLGIERDGYTHS